MLDEEKGEAGFEKSTGERTRTETLNSPVSKNSIASNNPFDSSRGLLKRISNTWHTQTAESTIADSDADEEDLVVRKLHESPKGYPMLATFLDSEDIFSIYRRFGYLQSRLLLEKQDELRRLEEDLDYHDQNVPEDCELELQTRDYVEGQEPPQRAILQQIETKFLEYANLLQVSQTIMAMRKPSSHEYRSLKNWMHIFQPVVADEQNFVTRKEDLVTLRPGREHAWLDSMIEKTIRHLSCKPITWLFRTKETSLKCDGKHGEHYFTRSRIDFCSNTIITLMILILLVLPIYILYHLTSLENSGAQVSINPQTGDIVISGSNGNGRINAICIGVLVVSTLAFSAGVSLFSRAKRHEILAASAGYCAVLVVFIGNVGGGGLF